MKFLILSLIMLTSLSAANAAEKWPSIHIHHNESHALNLRTLEGKKLYRQELDKRSHIGRCLGGVIEASKVIRSVDDDPTGIMIFVGRSYKGSYEERQNKVEIKIIKEHYTDPDSGAKKAFQTFKTIEVKPGLVQNCLDSTIQLVNDVVAQAKAETKIEEINESESSDQGYTRQTLPPSSGSH